MNKDEQTPEVKEVEKPKVEERVIENPKRGYFFPHHNFGTEASSLEDAQKQLEEHLKKTKKETS